MGAYKRKYRDDSGKVVKEDQWRFRKLIKLPDGSTTRVTGTPDINTKEAALVAERRAIELAQNPVKAAGNETFAGFWVKRYAPTLTNKKSVIEEKAIHFANHLEPALGNLRLAAIGPETLENLKAALVKTKKLSEKTARNVFATLRKALVSAVEWQELAALPKFPKFKVEDAEWDHLVQDEVEQLLAAARDDHDRTLLHFALKTGARAGELLSAQWDDVDWKAPQLRFRRSRTRGETGSTKSKRHRSVPLSPQLLDELRSLQSESRGRSLIFAGPDGKPLRIGQLHECLWRTLKRAGLRKIRWHDLRHSYASNLAAAGVPILQVQQWLGHSSIQMTMRYAHLAPGGNLHLVSVLDGAKSPPIGKPVAKALSVQTAEPKKAKQLQ